MRKTVVFFSAVALLLLTAAGCSGGQGVDYSRQIEDMDLVVTAQQGRIQNLEKELADLKLSLASLEAKVSEMPVESTMDTGLMENLKKENEELVRMLFQAMATGIQRETLEAFIEDHEAVYAFGQGQSNGQLPFWVTGGSESGDLYMHSSELGSIQRVDVFENIEALSWADDDTYFLVETKSDALGTGYIYDSKALKKLGSFEYKGMPVWGNTFIVYLNDNPSVLYTGTETSQMHATGVFFYSFSNHKFAVIDAGGKDYNCSELSVDESGEINYIQINKDGTQSFVRFQMN